MRTTPLYLAAIAASAFLVGCDGDSPSPSDSGTQAEVSVTDTGGGPDAAVDVPRQDVGSDAGTADVATMDAARDVVSVDVGSDAGTADVGVDAGTADVPPATVTLTIVDVQRWCDVTVGGVHHVAAAPTSVSVAAGSVVMASADTAPGFVWGCWAGLNGNIATTSTVHAQNITVSATRTVYVCCPVPGTHSCSADGVTVTCP